MKYYKLPSNPTKVCGAIGKKATSMDFWTGIRSGEILSLTLKDFDFEEKNFNN